MVRRKLAWLSLFSALVAVALPLVALLGALTVTAPGCDSGEGGQGEGGAAPDAGGSDSGDASHPKPDVITFHPNAKPLPGESACTVTETTGIPVSSANHLPICTPIEYSTNPPSGGDHWPAWTTYSKHTSPVPREMYVHNLEHGGVVLSYRCKDACPEVLTALGEVFDITLDPLCATQPTAPAARAVLTPDPDLPAPIAVSAWGATYVATCIDKPSLQSFIAKVIGHGTEPVCGDGQDPALVLLNCVDGGLDAGADGS